MKTADIIIFGGQSNMQGQTEALDECEAVGEAFEYKMLTDELVPLRNPVGENVLHSGEAGWGHKKGENGALWLSSHVFGASAGGKTNLVPSFCRAYIKECGRSVIAVHAAKGSTEIKQWLPGTNDYAMLIKKATLAISKARERYDIGNVYFVWLQGESDAVMSNNKTYYKEKLSQLAEGLKKDLAIGRFGVIRVGRFTRDERDDEIIAAQDEICNEQDFFLMLTTIATALNEDSQYMNPEAKGHFSALGLTVLGKAAGEALGKASR